ncbi:MAG: 50S ribosome-binding GTPase [Phycisphaerales bacterium]|nr:MAG: 50S ribosome-binding GTPase [Phycisphaerales bacterium]
MNNKPNSIRSEDRSAGAPDVRSLPAALNVIVAGSAELTGRLALPWTDEDAEMAAALRFLLGAAPGAPTVLPLRTAGIVGGASSGKSTLFNNLLGGRHASHVTMMSHTTKGPVLAVHLEAEDTLAEWLNGDHLFMPRLSHATANPDDRTEGRTGVLTVIGVHADLPSDLLLVDTPDFTSQAALREGDTTRNMLCWFDCVLVMVDEDRWFDRQTFGWLRDRLDRYELPRLVVFNRNERGGPLSEPDLIRLANQASRLHADQVVVEHVPGRGLRTLPTESLAPIREWLTQSGAEGNASRRRARLEHLLGDRAGHVLNANAQRLAWLESLDEALAQTIRSEMKSEAALAYNVLLSTSQARMLSPYWQGFARPGVWLAERTSALLRRIPGMEVLTGLYESPGSDEEATDDIITRGTAFFAAEVTRIADHLLVGAADSPLFERAAFRREQRAALRPKLAEQEEKGRQQAARCGEAFKRFVEAVERGAAALDIRLAASGGLLAGAVIGAVLTAPAGGFGLPAGALIGAAIGGPATGLSARSMVRLYKTLARSPERRHLWDAIKDYRGAIIGELEAVQSSIQRLGRGTTLSEKHALYQALTVLRDRTGWGAAR